MFWPLRGCIDFLFRPRLWLTVLSASWLANAIIVGVGIIGLIVYWPWTDTGFSWQHVAHWQMGIAAAAVLVVPLIRSRAGRVVIAPMLKELGRDEDSLGGDRGFMAAMGHLLRYLPFRIIWILAALGGSVLHPTAGALVAAIGIGHLTAVDAMDQSLVACQCDAQTRRNLRGRLFTESFASGITAGILFLAASLVIVGSLLWVPGIFMGAARRAHQLSSEACADKDEPVNTADTADTADTANAAADGQTES